LYPQYTQYNKQNNNCVTYVTTAKATKNRKHVQANKLALMQRTALEKLMLLHVT